MKELIYKVVDDRNFFELQKDYAAKHHHRFRPHAGIHGGFCGQSADGPGRMSRYRLSEKGPFQSVLRCLHIPVVTFVDVPAFFLAPARSTAASSSMAPKLSYAYAEATIPKSRDHRKVYGGA